MTAAATGDGNERACGVCHGTGWRVRGYFVCDCRAGDYAWAAWEGMTIVEYDARAIGTADYHGPDAVVRVSDT